MLCEELERIDTFARVIISVHLSLNSLALYQWGTPDQWERWRRPQAKGEKVAAFALTEPEAGTDAASLATRAQKVPGGYRLTGIKAWIGLADVADHFLVFATVDPELAHRGVTAFLLRRETEGLRTESITGKHGIRAGNVGRIYLEDAFVPEEDRLGEEGEGFTIAMSALDNGRFGVAAGSVGIIRACLDQLRRRLSERQRCCTDLWRPRLQQRTPGRAPPPQLPRCNDL